MTPTELITAFANFSGFVMALFMMAALLYPSGSNRKANRILALLIALLGVKFLYDCLAMFGWIYESLPHVVFLQFPLIFSFGPLLYLYLWKITARSEDVPGYYKRAMRACLLAPLIFLLAYLPALFLSTEELIEIMRFEALRSRGREGAVLDPIQLWLWFITIKVRMPALVLQLGVCVASMGMLINGHRRRMEQYFSNTEKVNLAWVIKLWSLTLLIWALVPLRLVLFGSSPAADWLGIFLVLLQVVLAFLLGLFGLLQAPIVADPANDPSNGKTGGKYGASGLTPLQAAEFQEKLLAFMETAKPYLDSELTLNSLASRLDMPSRHLSQLVNGSLGTNFLDFVNSYRVDEAKRQFDACGRQRKVLDVALEVGFNSKSAFYTAFKRHAAMTPTEYRRRAFLPQSAIEGA